jgi:hypothetical protein
MPPEHRGQDGKMPRTEGHNSGWTRIYCQGQACVSETRGSGHDRPATCQEPVEASPVRTYSHPDSDGHQGPPVRCRHDNHLHVT